jgi:intein/homing endonuclease
MKNWSAAVHETQEIRHKKTVADHEVERKKLLAVIAEKDQQLNIALGISGEKPVASKIKVAKETDAEATFVAVASDWHVEETVEGKTINGLNEFNLDIAEQRINRFWQSIVRMAEIQRHGAKIERLVLVLGGDLMTGYIHEELMENNALSPTQTVLWLQDQIASGVDLLSKHFGEISIPCVYGNHGRCHDDETELLTRHGWRKYNEIKIGDVVATYNMETGKNQWQELTDIFISAYTGKMIHVKTATADYKVTPNHRMVVKTHTGNDKFEDIQTIVDKGSFGSLTWPKCALGQDEEPVVICDDVLRLLGWIMTDGSYGHQRGRISVRIHQSKQEGIDKIQDILNRLGLCYGDFARDRDTAHVCGRPLLSKLTERSFTLSSESSKWITDLLPDKYVFPEWFMDLSTRQFGIFLSSVIDGDGHTRGEECVIYGREHFLSQLQSLAVIHGIAARVRKDNRGDSILSLPKSKRGHINDFKNQVFEVDYEGTIWCGTVPNGTLITRRNGIPLVSGNSTKKPRHATGAANSYEWMLYKTMAKHLKDKASWHVSDGYHLLLDLYGKTLRIHHGDGLQYQGGVGGLTIPVEKAIAAWNKGVPADLDIFGHWHQSQQNPKWVCNGCFTGEAKVMTPNGIVEIRDVKKGDKVFAHDGSLQTVEATMQKISENGLIEIRAKGLPDFIKCTPNHEFFAIKGESQLRQRLSPMKTHPNKEKPRWIKAEDLSEGDWVCTPELQGDKIYDTDLLWVYGLFTAEGHSLIGAGAKGYVNKIGFTMHIKELPVLERAKSILDKHFGKIGYIYTREKRTTSGLEYHGKEIAEQWQAWFGHTCYEKKIPDWIFSLTKECREAFVQGWYDGDGHRCKQMGGTSASRQLAWGIHWLSVGTRFNSMLYLRNKRPKGHVKGFCESYHLGFVKGQDVAFVDGKRFVRIDYRGRLDDKVTVFDLQVSGPHTYNVGGMGVHNSLIGFNAYSVAIKAPYEPPSQTGFIFDKRYGRTVTFPIFV